MPLITTVTGGHLEFHHGILAHLVPPCFGDVVDAYQLGLVPHAVPLKPAQQVFIRLLRDWRKKQQQQQQQQVPFSLHAVTIILTMITMMLTSSTCSFARVTRRGYKGRVCRDIWGANPVNFGLGVDYCYRPNNLSPPFEIALT